MFRKQPTPGLASQVRERVRTALSPNDRLQQLFHPWTSYLIVPLFALANAGITVSGGFLARAYASPVTLGILIGYVAAVSCRERGRGRVAAAHGQPRPDPPARRLGAAITGAGAIAGVGFVVSLLIATLAFRGTELAEAKVGLACRQRSAHRFWPGSSSGSPRCCPSVCGCERCWAVPTPSSTWPCPLTRTATTSAARRGRGGHPRRVRRLRVPVLRAGRVPRSGNCWPTTATCGTCGVTYRSPMCTRMLNSPPRWRKPPRPRADSGRCTTCCSIIRAPSRARDLVRYAAEAGPGFRAVQARYA